MIIIDYQKKNHNQIVRACVNALRAGKVIAYPTDTSYGLAVDAENFKAIKKLYKIKERGFNKPVHIVAPSIAYAKKIARWTQFANRLSLKFWPGALTLVLPLKIKDKGLRIMSAKTGTIGIRYPKNNIALDLAKYLKSPITATSANPSAHLSGGYDSFDAKDVVAQFKNRKHQPDIVINAGKLPKRKPSTLVRIDDGQIKILRQGPVSEKQIRQMTKMSKNNKNDKN